MHDPEYLAYVERRREALISHQEITESVERKPIISEHYYHDVFVNEFNIHFGLPRLDIGDNCDSLKIRTEEAETEEAETDEEKSKLKRELKDHLKLADQGYASLRKYCERCQESWPKVTENTDI